MSCLIGIGRLELVGSGLGYGFICGVLCFGAD